METVERLGYRPSGVAHGLATHRTLTIGLVVPDIANPFFAEVSRGAEDTAHVHGYSQLLASAIEDPEREIEILRTYEEKRVDGMILCSTRLPDAVLRQMIGQLPPVVLVNRVLQGAPVGVVRVDDSGGARMATEHLLAMGRRHLGFLAGPPSSHSGRERTLGFVAALEDAGLRPHSDQIVHCLPYVEDGRSCAKELLERRSELDALFCYNDLVAIGALQACGEMGRRVPEDVALVGVDNVLLSSLVYPPLTTVHVSKWDLGAAAMDLLLRRLDDPAAAGACAEVLVRPQLIVRESAPYPGGVMNEGQRGASL